MSTTTNQRALTALALANDVKRARRDVCEGVRSGRITLREALDDPGVQSMPVADLLARALYSTRYARPARDKRVLFLLSSLKVGATVEVGHLNAARRDEVAGHAVGGYKVRRHQRERVAA